jgi:hypothetical protein
MGAPSPKSSSGKRPVTVARVPTGMNAGVSITPRGVPSVPRRARSSRAVMENGSTRRRYQPENGNSTVNVAPLPGWLSREMRPLCAFTIWRTRYRPSPRLCPEARVVARSKGSKILC